MIWEIVNLVLFFFSFSSEGLPVYLIDELWLSESFLTKKNQQKPAWESYRIWSKKNGVFYPSNTLFPSNFAQGNNEQKICA